MCNDDDFHELRCGRNTECDNINQKITALDAISTNETAANIRAVSSRGLR